MANQIIQDDDPHFVIKAQISQFTSDGSKRVLIYDTSRAINYEQEATPEMVKKFGDKSYWWATVNTKGMLEIFNIKILDKDGEELFEQNPYRVATDVSD